MALDVNTQVFGRFPEDSTINIPVFEIINRFAVAEKIVFEEPVAFSVIKMQSTK